MSDHIRIIIVEDNRDIRENIVEYLSHSGLNVTGVGSGLEFFQTITETTFDIAVFDVGLPDQNGYQLAEYARQKTPMGIIIMTARGETEDRLCGYSSGADLYLVKPVDCRELEAAIRNLSARVRVKPGKTALDQPADVWFLETSTWRLVSPNKCTITLTAKEMQFVSCLAAASGSTVNRDTLLEKLGYADDEYANRAMDSLVRRLRRKIEELSPASSPLKTVHTMGYCFSAPIVTV